MVISAPSETLLARPPQSGFSLRAKGSPTPFSSLFLQTSMKNPATLPDPDPVERPV